MRLSEYIDWFGLCRPFILMVIMMLAMWEPKRKPKRKDRDKND